MTDKQRCKAWRPFLYCAGSYSTRPMGTDTYSIIDGSTGETIARDHLSESKAWKSAWTILEPELNAASHQAQPED